jgi:5-methyltetrahydropteroyltriglutamate--homocysteine methyltransferase
MNDFLREKLCELLAAHGRPLLNDRERCEALLWQAAGDNSQGMFALLGGLQRKVPHALLTAPPERRDEALLAKLTQRLVKDLGLDEPAARWAVECWVLAVAPVPFQPRSPDDPPPEEDFGAALEDLLPVQSFGPPAPQPREPTRVPGKTVVKSFLEKLPLFPTAVIGSLPRPAWLLDVLKEYLAGRVPRSEWGQACDHAVPSAVGLQEAAGIDIITDGEWRREGYFQVFYERVDGFKPGLIQGRTRTWPAAVAPLRRRGPVVSDGVEFLRRLTRRAIKVTLPSAYVILRRFYSPEHSARAYPTREHFLRAVEGVLLAEARDVLDEGADCVQFDDPMLGYFVDPKYREQRSGHWGTGQFKDADAELRLGIESINRLAGPLRQRRAHVVLHVCRGNIERRSDAQGDFRPIWSELCRVQVDELALEFAMPQAGTPDVLAELPPRLRLGFGCVDVRSAEVETPETIAGRVREALRHLPAERLTLNPDCGFAPSGDNPIPPDEPYAKLRALAEAARRLRVEHAGRG